jgi:hypothetical protein
MEKITINNETGVVADKGSTFDKTPFWILTALLILIPIFVIPTVSVSFFFGKISLLTVAVLVSLIITIFSVIRAGKISVPGWRTLVLFLIVPVATIVSAFLSVHRPTSFLGFGDEFDTVHFVSLGFLLIALVAMNFQSKQRIFLAYVSMLGIFSLVSLFHVIRFFAGPAFLNPGGLFTSVVSNMVGNWSDLGVYAGLAIILSFIMIEFVDIGKKLKFSFYLALVLGLCMLAVTNFYIVTGVFGLAIPLTAIVGLVALFVFVYIISQNYGGAKKMPKASLIVLIFCIVMSIGATPIATSINGKLGITQNDIMDVRPTLTGTKTVAEGLVKEGGPVRAIFGVGPNRFVVAWGLFKPAAVNQTIFWNSDFNYGSGYVVTSIVTIGIAGFLAWLLFLIGTLIIGTRSVFSVKKDRFSTYLIVSSLLASFYLWIIAFFSVSTPTILILTFFFTGLLAASLVREKTIKVKEYTWIGSQKKGFVAVFLLIILLIAVIAWGFAWTQRLVASYEMKKAAVALKAAENIPESGALITSAIQRAPSVDAYWRSFSQLKLIELQAEFEKAGNNELGTSTQIILQQALLAAQTAAQQNPTDYHNFIFLGQVYQTAGLLGAEKAGDAALQSYQAAAAYIPSSPLPAYLAGYLFALAKDPENAKAALQQSLELKPDFQEAYTLYNQLQPANAGARSTESDDVQTSSSPAKTTATSSRATR